MAVTKDSPIVRANWLMAVVLVVLAIGPRATAAHASRGHSLTQAGQIAVQQERDPVLPPCLLNDRFAPFSLQAQKPFAELLQAPSIDPALARHVGAWSGTMPARPPFAPEQAVRVVIFPNGRAQYVGEDFPPGSDARSYVSTQLLPDGGLRWSTGGPVQLQYTLVVTDDPVLAQLTLVDSASSVTATLTRCSVAQVDAAAWQAPQTRPAAGPESVTYFETRARPWTRVPAVVIASEPDDPRIAMVAAAIDYWNGELSAIGSGFRVGAVQAVVGPLPGEVLVQRSEAVLTGQRGLDLPESAVGLPGDLVVALSNANFVSFSGAPGVSGRVLVGVSGNQPPRSLPNVMPNVIAHELGHAIGLGHNNDPTLLMCGRPATCRPDAFQAPTPRMFPITDEERATLLRLYPPDWRPSP